MTTTSSSPAVEFEPHARDVYAWAYRVLGRHHDALDVVQDVFLRWARQCGDNPPRQPRGWLRRVTLNRAIDLCRLRGADAALMDGVSETRETSAGHTNVGEELDREALRNDIASSLQELTDVQRGVLVAKVFDEMTFAQIAAELSLSVSTIKTHYLRAVRAVRDRLHARWA